MANNKYLIVGCILLSYYLQCSNITPLADLSYFGAMFTVLFRENSLIATQIYNNPVVTIQNYRLPSLLWNPQSPRR